MTSQKTCQVMQLINTFGGKEMNVVRLFCLLCVCSVLFGCKSVSRKQSSGEQKSIPFPGFLLNMLKVFGWKSVMGIWC